MFTIIFDIVCAAFGQNDIDFVVDCVHSSLDLEKSRNIGCTHRYNSLGPKSRL